LAPWALWDKNSINILKWINQLRFSAARWQHGFGLCFATFSLQIIAKWQITQQTEKMTIALESLEFQKLFNACLTKFKNNPMELQA
jgi:hypothetical protein